MVFVCEHLWANDLWVNSYKQQGEWIAPCGSLPLVNIVKDTCKSGFHHTGLKRWNGVRISIPKYDVNYIISYVTLSFHLQNNDKKKQALNDLIYAFNMGMGF